MRAPTTIAEVNLFSYASSQAAPSGARYVYNVSGLRDPIGQPHLRDLASGASALVRDWIALDPRVGSVVEDVLILAESHLRGGGEHYLGFAFHDYHGRFISPAVVEECAEALEGMGYVVSVSHVALGEGDHGA